MPIRTAVARLTLVLTCGLSAAPAVAAEPAAEEAVAYRWIALRKDDPTRGPADAPVTLVLFSSFQCVHCAHFAPTVRRLERAHPGQVRIVWKHLPLRSHEHDLPAALAAEAAREQGKFWEMHDRLLADQDHLTPEAFTRHARALKLDPKRFQAAVEEKRYQDRIEADRYFGSRAGVDGVPATFVNCRKVTGAVSYAALEAVFEEELARALALPEDDRAGVHARACAANLALAPPPDEPPGLDEAALGVRPDDPVRGPADAPVTIVLFSSFQCVHCGRFEPRLRAVEREFPGLIRVVWKHLPMPSIHPHDLPAALAAEAAREQGKFWELHDRLLADQDDLGPAALDRHARELGLDLARFQAAQRSAWAAERIEEDVATALALGVDGAPTMFVNGERFAGAIPLEALEALVGVKLGPR